VATRKKTGRKTAGKSAAAASESTGAPKRKSASKRPQAPKRASTGRRRKGAGTEVVAGEARRAEVLRETSETRISVCVAIEEPGYSVATGVPFLDHMLEALSRHSNIGLTVEASGDTHIDDHHTVEDVGLAVGEALRRALGEKAGIYRFGHFEAPLDEALVAVTVDLSGRPYLVYNVGSSPSASERSTWDWSRTFSRRS